MDNTLSHQRIRDRLYMLLQDQTLSDKRINKVKKLIDTHQGFTTELNIEYEECKGIVNHGFPSMVDDTWLMKDKHQWITECRSLLSSALSVAHADVLDMNEMREQVEGFVTTEIAVRDIIFNATTYKQEKYLQHIKKCGQLLDGKRQSMLLLCVLVIVVKRDSQEFCQSLFVQMKGCVLSFISFESCIYRESFYILEE